MQMANAPGQLLVLAAMAALAGPVAAQTVHARLQGFQEVPAVSSPGSGAFRAKIDRGAGMIYYELSYAGLQGEATMSHIHVGQHGVNGGISVWLCTTPLAPVAAPAGTQQCPANNGMISGTIMAGNVVGPGGQLISAGEFNELLRAIRAGVTYVNVHTTAVGSGEIRGQIRGNNGEGGGIDD